MKTSAFHALASAAALFVLCASTMAAGPQGNVAGSANRPSIIQTACLKCHGGGSVNGEIDFRQRLTLEQRIDAISKAASGEMPKSGPKLTPQQLSQLKIELGFTSAGASGASAATNAAAQKAAASRAASQKAASAAVANLKQAQGRISVVSPPSSNQSNLSNKSNLSNLSSTSSVPTARVRIVPPGSASSTQAARVVVVTADDTSSTAAAVRPAPIVKPQPISTTTPDGTDDLAKIPDALKGLVGNWMAVSRQGDGELSTVELQLDDHGWAKLTVPSTDGKPSTTTKHKVELKDNKLELTSQNGTISLGKVVSADGRQMVLEQETGLLTFVRP